jgi:hypothetical protein
VLQAYPIAISSSYCYLSKQGKIVQQGKSQETKMQGAVTGLLTIGWMVMAYILGFAEGNALVVKEALKSPPAITASAAKTVTK